jgi:transcriptional regulator with XRE-family HTH domain
MGNTKSLPYKTTIRVNFGKKVRELRDALGLRQEDIAYKAGFETSHLGMVERGERNITLDKIEKLAKALNATPKDLFDF